MLIVNGTITAKIKTGGGTGTDGYHDEPVVTWAPPVPCNIKMNSGNNLVKHNGNTSVIYSYEVLIEPQPFEAGRVRLTENGRDLGEFSVLCTECLDSVGAVKIVV
jgi:hypothetical protein